MEFIQANIVVIIIVLLLIGYFLKRVMNRDGERGYISSLVFFGIKDINLEENNSNIALINQYLDDEYKIKGKQKEYHVAYNLLIRYILNDYFKNERTAKGKELKDSHVYLMTRIYEYCSRLTNSYGSKNNVDFNYLADDKSYGRKDLNDTGIVLMKMYLSSLNFIKQKKIKVDINGLSEETIKEVINKRILNVN